MQEPSDDPPPRYPRGLYLVAVVDFFIGIMIVIVSISIGFGSFFLAKLSCAAGLLSVLLAIVIFRLALDYFHVAGALADKGTYRSFSLLLTSFLNLIFGLLGYLGCAYQVVMSIANNDLSDVIYYGLCSSLPILALISGYIGFAHRKRWQSQPRRESSNGAIVQRFAR